MTLRALLVTRTQRPSATAALDYRGLGSSPLLIPPSAISFVQTYWGNQTSPVPRQAYFDQGSRIALSLLATVYEARTPLYTRIPTRSYIAALEQIPQNTAIRIVNPTTQPFGQYDWPNPRRLVNSQAPVQYGVPIPSTALAITYSLRASFETRIPQRQMPTDLRSITQSSNIPLLGLTFNPAFVYWENPELAKRIPQIQPEPNILALSRGPSNATIARTPLETRIAALQRRQTDIPPNTLAQQFPPTGVMPFIQSDWQNPLRRRVQQNDNPPNLIAITNAPTQPKPEATFDYTMPRRLSFSYALAFVGGYAFSPRGIPIVGGPGMAHRGGRVILQPIYAGEIVNTPFDFISYLAIGETILTAEVTSTVYSGTDPNPAGVIIGPPTASGTIVTQALQGGLVGVTYSVVCAITTSNNQSLQLAGFLVVQPPLV